MAFYFKPRLIEIYNLIIGKIRFCNATFYHRACTPERIYLGMTMINIIKTGLISISILAVSACATSTTPKNTETQVNAPKTETTIVSKPAIVAKVDNAIDGEKKICKRSVPTGSRFTKKICMTKNEWDAIRETARQSTQDFQRKGAGNTVPGS